MVKQRWKYFHQQWNLSKVKVKTVKKTKRLKDENRARRNIFVEISCLSHCFAETIVTNPRLILQNWRRFMFLRCPATKTFLTFLTSIMGWEILNNIGKNILQKLHVKSSFCREYCGQSEIPHTKLKDYFVPKKPIYKNLS